ncbi:MAG: hypothetical protein JRC86_01540 [Deltaproteobacteria bacterium]|nr:hypothetical protein [Deltaproteobacteria bacterium]
MVEIVEDLEDLKEVASYCKYVVYRVDEAEEGKYRVRIGVSRFGYDGLMSAKELDEVRKWLKRIGAIKVVDSVPDGMFFA